jgi:predicted ester cyclase
MVSLLCEADRVRGGVLVEAEANKAVIRRLIEEVYNEDNLDVVDELVAPDIFNHAAVPEHQHGIDGFKHVMEWVREFSSDVHYDIDDIISEGDKVAVRMTHSGTHTGTVRGIPPLARVSRSTTSIGSVLRTERSRSCGP